MFRKCLRSLGVFYALAFFALSMVSGTVQTNRPAIQRSVDAVSWEALRESIYELQENFDLNPPHKPFRSRLFWRTSNSLDPSRDATDNAAEYIYRKFSRFRISPSKPAQGLGLQVEYDPFSVEWVYPMVMEPVVHKQRNVIATLPGRGPEKEKVIIVCAHYDSANDPALEWDDPDWDPSQGHAIWKNVPAPGANDNASGMASVIEAARILSQSFWNHTIKFAAFACEEYRCSGSWHYAQRAEEEGEKIAGVINVDMIGYQPDPDRLQIRLMGTEECESLIDAFTQVGIDHDIPLQIVKRLKPERGDDEAFRTLGYLAVRIAEMPGYSHYHTEKDTMDKLNKQSVTQTTRLLVAILAEWAGVVE